MIISWPTWSDLWLVEITTLTVRLLAGSGSEEGSGETDRQRLRRETVDWRRSVGGGPEGSHLTPHISDPTTY